MSSPQKPEYDHETSAPPFEYSRIDDQVFIGTDACCITHFSDMLLAEGITADISLQAEKLDHPGGVSSFLWVPTKDHTPPDEDITRAGVAYLEELLASGTRVYIHCKNGHGRAPTFYAAYLILKKGMSADDAITTIAKAREVIHLEPSQRAFLAQLSSD